MVKTELNYNPYIKETVITFNEQPPRINSLVEKYQSTRLQEWIQKIPKIFYDEMNGYDFELDFSGTQLDFDEVAASFRKAGVNEEEVRIFHKNELDGRKRKVEQIEELLRWLQENLNRRFEKETFFKQNQENFDLVCPLIILHGNELEKPDFTDMKVSAEVMNGVEELDNTALQDTPIIICLNSSSADLLQNDLSYFLARDDVSKEQLFFIIYPTLDRGKAVRLICDLGITEPQILATLTDDILQKYIELYPLTDGICRSIEILQEKADLLNQELEAEIHRSEIENQGIYAEIDLLENTIEKLKESSSCFINRDNIEKPEQWQGIREILVQEINNWRKKKTKVVGETEASQAALEFEMAVQEQYGIFVRRLLDSEADAKRMIDDRFLKWYFMAGVDKQYHVPEIDMGEADVQELTGIRNGVLELKEENYVMPKNDLVGFFFKSISAEEQKPVLEISYYFQNWREYALGKVLPLLDGLIAESYQHLQDYSNQLAEQYIRHLSELTESYKDKKEVVSSQLSAEEQLLQTDSTWLATFKDQLEVIERG